MSRHYTDFERQLILQCLVANDYDISLTSLRTGASERTLARWQKKYLPPIQPFHQGTPSLGISSPIPPLSPNEVQAFQDIKRQLMNQINQLSHSFEDAIADAPLNQRAVALTHFINSVIKISAQIPPDPMDFIFEDVEGEEYDGEIESSHTSFESTSDPR